MPLFLCAIFIETEYLIPRNETARAEKKEAMSGTGPLMLSCIEFMESDRMFRGCIIKQSSFQRFAAMCVFVWLFFIFVFLFDISVLRNI